MTGKILVDTNVLVYAYDRSEPEKQKRAIDVLDALFASGVAVISKQVLIEFLNAVIRKIRQSLSIADGYERIVDLADAWTVLPMTASIVREAARGARDHRLSIWDAQIWATAREHHLPVVLSEDLSDGSVLEDVRFLNPFRPDFRLADYL